VHSPFASQEDQPPLRLESATPHRHLRAVLAVAAAVVVVVLVAVGLGITLSSPAPAPVSAVAALQHMDAPSTASGVATVRSIGTTRTMVVTTAGLPAAPTNHYYEVWLLEPSTNKMLALGLLAPSGRGSFAVSGPIMAQFSAVDISLQANNGNPAHSKTSVLRGPVVAQRA
jgi:anti-sigma-K factor RskA